MRTRRRRVAELMAFQSHADRAIRRAREIDSIKVLQSLPLLPLFLIGWLARVVVEVAIKWIGGILWYGLVEGYQAAKDSAVVRKVAKT
jgi:rhamnogalacturonyl hydrolase YesR